MNQNNKYILRDDNTISLKFLSTDIKNYHQFCTMFGLKQLIKSPTRVTLTDHILASFPLRVFQKGVTDVGLSDQLVFCSQKISQVVPTSI